MIITFYPKAMGNWFSSNKEEVVVIAEKAEKIAEKPASLWDSSLSTIMPWIEIAIVAIIVFIIYSRCRKAVKAKFQKHVERATNLNRAEEA